MGEGKGSRVVQLDKLDSGVKQAQRSSYTLENKPTIGGVGTRVLCATDYYPEKVAEAACACVYEQKGNL